MEPTITQDLLNETNSICSVGFIKKEHRVEVVLPILFSYCNSFFDKFAYISFCNTTMHLCYSQRDKHRHIDMKVSWY